MITTKKGEEGIESIKLKQKYKVLLKVLVFDKLKVNDTTEICVKKMVKIYWMNSLKKMVKKRKEIKKEKKSGKRKRKEIKKKEKKEKKDKKKNKKNRNKRK